MLWVSLLLMIFFGLGRMGPPPQINNNNNGIDMEMGMDLNLVPGGGGKLQIVNSALSSLPTFYMCAIKVPIDILNQVDKYRRHCL
jgi:hypothetical protein